MEVPFYDTPGPVQAAGPVAPGMVEAPTSLGGAPAAPHTAGFANAPDNGLADMLFKFSDKLLAPKLAEAQARQLADGAILAMQGTAAASIRDQDMMGWFGDSNLVAGARQVEVMTAVTSTSNAIMEKLQDPEILAMAPEQFRQWLPGQYKAFLTGDQTSDALVTQAALERWPAVVEAHLKGHIAFKNDRARQAYEGAAQVGIQAYSADQKAHVAGAISDEQFAASKQRLVANLLPPDGINPAKTQEFMAATIARAIDDGHLAAVEELLETGIPEKTLDDPQISAINRSLDRAKQKAANESPQRFEVGQGLGELRTAVAMGPAGPFKTFGEALVAAKKFDAAAQARYGYNAPVLSEADVASLAASWHHGEQAGLERIARMQGAAEDDEARLQAGIGVIISHKIPESGHKVKREDLDRARDYVFANLISKGPQEQAELWGHVAADTDKWPVVEQRVYEAVTLLRAGNSSPKLHAALETIRSLDAVGGQKLVGRYVGEDAEDILDALNEIDAAQTPEAKAKIVTDWKGRYGRPRVELSPEQKTEISAKLNTALDLDEGLWADIKSPFVTEPLEFAGVTQAQKDSWLPEMSQLVQKHMTRGASFEKATERAMGDLTNRYDIVSGFLVKPLGASRKFIDVVNEPLKQAGAMQVISQSSPLYQKAIRELEREKFQAIYTGGWFSELVGDGKPQIGSINQVDGALQFGYTGMAGNVVITAADVRDRIKSYGGRSAFVQGLAAVFGSRPAPKGPMVQGTIGKSNH